MQEAWKAIEKLIEAKSTQADSKSAVMGRLHTRVVLFLVGKATLIEAPAIIVSLEEQHMNASSIGETCFDVLGVAFALLC